LKEENRPIAIERGLKEPTIEAKKRKKALREETRPTTIALKEERTTTTNSK